MRVNKTMKFAVPQKKSLAGFVQDFRALDSCKARAEECFLFYMDLRFRGAWVKTDDTAKFWGRSGVDGVVGFRVLCSLFRVERVGQYPGYDTA